MKRILKIPAYVAAIIILLVSVVVYVYFFTTLPETELNGWFYMLLSRNTGLQLTFQRINRDLWNRAVIEGIEISPRTDGLKPIVSISRLEVDYDIRKLIYGKYKIESVLVDSVILNIPEAKTRLIPAGGGQGAKGSKLSVSVGRISVLSGRIALQNGESIYIDSLFSSLTLDKGQLNLGIDRLYADWPSRGVKLISCSGKISSDENGLRIDTLEFQTERSRGSVSGRLGQPLAKKLDLQASFDPIDLDDVNALTGVKIKGNLTADVSVKGSLDDFGGNAFVNGAFMGKRFDNVRLSYAFSDKVLRLNSIDGLIFGAAFDGSGHIDFGAKPEEFSYEGKVGHLDLREIGPQLKTDFTGSVQMQGAGLNERQLHMSLRADLDSVRIENYYFDEVSGPADFNLQRIQFLPGFKARYKHTYLEADGYLEYQGNLDIGGSAEFQDLRDFTGQVFLQQLGGKGTADVHATGPVTDFNVVGSFRSDSCWTYGLSPGHIDIHTSLKTFITHPAGVVASAWTGGTLYSVPTDSGYMAITVSGNMVFFDSIKVDSPVSTLRLNGEYDGTTVPPVFRADTLYGVVAGNRFFSREPVRLNIYPDSTEFERFAIGSGTGTVQVSGTVTNDLKLGLNVSAAGFEIENVLSQVYKEKPLSGVLFGTIGLRGDFQNPIINLDLEIDSLAMNKVGLGHLAAKAIYKDGYLTTTSASITSEFGHYSFSGQLPMNLSFQDVPNRFPDKPINMKLVASGDRLLLSEIYVPNIERFKTDFDIEFDLTGTYANPLVTGRGRLLNGELKVIDLVNPLTDVRAYFRMQNQMIYIDSVYAMVPTPGGEWTKFINELIPLEKGRGATSTLQASGTMELLTLGNFLYNISVEGRNFYFISDAYDVRGLADLNLSVTGSVPPTVSGQVILKRLEVRDEFDKFVPPGIDTSLVLEDSTLWDLNLEIIAANNIWIENSDVDAEFKGDVLVQRHVGVLNILGSLDVLRGTYNLVGQKFRVSSGSLTFKNVARVNPEIDFIVTTRLRSSAPPPAPQFTNAELHITGTLLEPNIDVGSGTALTREGLLQALVMGSDINPFTASQQLQSNFSRSLVQDLLPTLSSFVPDPLTGKGIVEEFEIYPTVQGQPEISVAKYISRSLYIRYSQRLSQSSGRTIGAEYYFNDNVSFQVTRGVQGSPNEGISFDLNFNHEY